MKEDIIKLIKEIIDLIKDVPEKYRVSCFEILLKHFLTQPYLPSRSTTPKKFTMKKTSETNNLKLMLSLEIDWATTGVSKFKGINQYLELLKIAKRELNDPKLSALEIKNILDQKFRVKKSISTISMSLMYAVGKDVDRIKENNEYRYRITASGEEKLEQASGGNKN